MNAVQFHLLLNHVPVIGAVLGVLLLGYGVFRGSSELMRASLGLIVVAAVVGFVVFLTGEPAEALATELAGVPLAAIERHEDAARVSVLMLGGAGLLALIGLLVFRRATAGVPLWFAAVAFLVALVPAAAMGYTANLGGQIRHTELRRELPSDDATDVQIVIPEAMRIEHTELHDALEAATQAPGRVGEAARAVALVLHPHFEREEQIALPPLGLLHELASGTVTPAMTAVLPLTDSLKAELPRMLEQHAAIGAALRKLAEVARAEGASDHAHLAERILLHAQNEEQVTYPAAILVGEYVRLRTAERQ